MHDLISGVAITYCFRLQCGKINVYDKIVTKNLKKGFNNLHCSVVWLNIMSASFHIGCGVRQGGVLSPVLF